MCDVGRYGIRGDLKNIYYCEVEKLLNIYSIQLGLGEAYGHMFVNLLLDDLSQLDWVVQRDDVQGDQLGICIRGGRMDQTMVV